MFQFAPAEQTNVLQLIRTDNKILNKVVTVIASICSEMDLLKVEGQTKFYNALTLYGEGGLLDSIDNFMKYQLQQPVRSQLCKVATSFYRCCTPSFSEPENGLAEGEAQLRIGRLMPLVQVNSEVFCNRFESPIFRAIRSTGLTLSNWLFRILLTCEIVFHASY